MTRTFARSAVVAALTVSTVLASGALAVADDAVVVRAGTAFHNVVSGIQCAVGAVGKFEAIIREPYGPDGHPFAAALTSSGCGSPGDRVVTGDGRPLGVIDRSTGDAEWSDAALIRLDPGVRIEVAALQERGFGADLGTPVTVTDRDGRVQFGFVEWNSTGEFSDTRAISIGGIVPPPDLGAAVAVAGTGQPIGYVAVEPFVTPLPPQIRVEPVSRGGWAISLAQSYGSGFFDTVAAPTVFPGAGVETFEYDRTLVGPYGESPSPWFRCAVTAVGTVRRDGADVPVALTGPRCGSVGERVDFPGRSWPQRIGTITARTDALTVIELAPGVRLDSGGHRAVDPSRLTPGTVLTARTFDLGVQQAVVIGDDGESITALALTGWNDGGAPVARSLDGDPIALLTGVVASSGPGSLSVRTPVVTFRHLDTALATLDEEFSFSVS